MVEAGESEFCASLIPCKLLIVLNEKNAKNTGFAQGRYTAGTRVALAPRILLALIWPTKTHAKLSSFGAGARAERVGNSRLELQEPGLDFSGLDR
jgi:hypothetical protein